MPQFYAVNPMFTRSDAPRTNPSLLYGQDGDVPSLPLRLTLGGSILDPLTVDPGTPFPGFNAQNAALFGGEDMNGPVTITSNRSLATLDLTILADTNTGALGYSYLDRKGNVLEEGTLQITAAGQIHRIIFRDADNLARQVVIQPVEDDFRFGVTALDAAVGVNALSTRAEGIAHPLVGPAMWNTQHRPGDRQFDEIIYYSFIKNREDLRGYGTENETFPGSALFARRASPLTETQQELFQNALGLWAEYADLTFSLANDDSTYAGHIRVGRAPIDGIAAARPGNEAHHGDIFLSRAAPGNPGATGAAEVQNEFIKGIGLALGLRDKSAALTLPGDLPLRKNSPEATVVDGQTAIAPGQRLIVEPSIHDVRAMQQMYGPNWDFRRFQDDYVFDPGAPVIYSTIWDAGGIDSFDASNYAAAVTIDLRPGGRSVLGEDQLAEIAVANGNVVQAAHNVAIPFLFEGDTRSYIENAHGGDGNDTLHGNATANVLRSNGGDDGVRGYGGRDRLTGGNGSDSLFGGGGSDVLYGDFETLNSRPGLSGGADELYGGKGPDLLRGGAKGDTLMGGSQDDRLRGEAGPDILNGGAGSDTLDGGFGRDRMTGGAGPDRFLFRHIDDSLPQNPDLITDFERGVDSLVAPALTGEVTVFAWLGRKPFGDEPGARFERVNNGIELQFDHDADGRADFSVELRGLDAIRSNDLFG